MAERLTDAQRERLHERLQGLRAELRRLLDADSEGTRPVDLGLPIGRLTRIDAIQQQQMAKAGRRGLEVRLRQVEAALAAWKRGEYGTCRSCDEPIPYRRLEARPETPLCVDCQSELERRR